MHTPALTIGIEVATDHAFVYAGTRAAPGGLPVGASGRALLLLSGGIDSPVAGWLAAKRGLALDAVYFHSPPYIGEKSRDKVLTLGRKLARWQALRSVTVVPFTDVQKRLRDAGPGELAVVLYRRMMMRIADAVADRLGATALVTGENLGQVASQTIENLSDDRGRRAPRWCCARSSPTTRSRPSRWRSASAPTRRRSCRSTTAARCSCRPTPPPAPGSRTPPRPRPSWTWPAEVAAAVAASERVSIA